jgi:hypothetical protein
MNEPQTKFAMTLVAFGLLCSYAIPKMKEVLDYHDAIAKQVGEVYIGSNPNDLNAPHGNVNVDDLQKYAEQQKSNNTQHKAAYAPMRGSRLESSQPRNKTAK